MTSAQAKGTVIQFVRAYVRATFGEAGFRKWLGSLDDASRELLEADPIPSSWYPVDAGVVTPLKAMVRMFYKGGIDGVWQCGRFGAENLASGVYRGLMETWGSPRLLERADRIGSLFYRPATFEVERVTPFEAILDLVDFHEPSLVLEQHLGGFVQRAIELSDNTDVRVRIESRLSAGDARTRYRVAWKPGGVAETAPR